MIIPSNPSIADTNAYLTLPPSINAFSLSAVSNVPADESDPEVVEELALPAEVAYLTLLLASAVLSTLESPTSLLEYDGLFAAFAHA